MRSIHLHAINNAKDNQREMDKYDNQIKESYASADNSMQAAIKYSNM